MKTLAAYAVLFVLLLAGAGFDSPGLRIFSISGLIGISLFYFVAYRGKAHRAGESGTDGNTAMDSGPGFASKRDYHPTGSADHEIFGHGESHHFGGGADSASVDGGDFGDPGSSD